MSPSFMASSILPFPIEIAPKKERMHAFPTLGPAFAVPAAIGTVWFVYTQPKGPSATNPHPVMATRRIVIKIPFPFVIVPTPPFPSHVKSSVNLLLSILAYDGYLKFFPHKCLKHQ